MSAYFEARRPGGPAVTPAARPDRRRPPGGLVLLAAAVIAPAGAAIVVLGALSEASLGAVLSAGAVAGVVGAVLARLHVETLSNERAAAVAAERDRVAAERELAAVTASNAAIFAALPDPLLMLSGEQRIVRANPAAEELFDAAPPERTLAGQDLTAVVRDPALLGAVDEVLHGADGRIAEFSLSGPVVRQLTARIARLAAPARDGTVAIMTFHDLTALKRAEQMRADFVANASHELRTPLSSLLGFIETLRGPARDDPEARERFLTVMQEQGRRMSRLVEDLLSLSRIELQEHTSPRGKTDLERVVRSVASTLQPQARAREMRIEVAIKDLPPAVGDPDELAQVFQNLIDNALKYGRSGTTVRITGHAVEAGTQAARRLGRPGIAVAVADQGEGIAREHVPRLTERFYRVDTARSRKLGGTGLGLAIVKHILNRHRGLLDIESTPGEGSVFTVILPRAGEGDRNTAR
jgi:two-component system phosphate regulon sensor histidine kinase PhoR